MSSLRRAQRRMAFTVAVGNAALGIVMIVLTLSGQVAVPLLIPAILLAAAAALFVAAFRNR